MSLLFKSELMTKCRFFVPPETAYGCIREIGELGCVQFVDLNPEAATFQRQFVSDVKRCESFEQFSFMQDYRHVTYDWLGVTKL